MTNPKPVPSNLYPTLTYDDANEAIEWLCRAFGFRKRLVVPGPGGTVKHSELSLGPGVIMVSSPKPEQDRVGPRAAGESSGVCVRVENPDAVYKTAKAAGAEITRELKDEEYGSRGFMAKDCGGHIWYFGTYSPGAYWEDKS